MVSGSGRRAMPAARPGRTTSSSAISPRTSLFELGVSLRRGPAPAPESRARVDVLRQDLVEPPRRRGHVDRPPDADDLVRKHTVAVRVPIRVADAIDRRPAEV